jgi:KDO2-lipid IV(A) lauroyltransferase
LVYHVVRYRRQTVADNLAAAFPERSARELRVLEKRFYRHLCDLAVEILALRTMPLAEIQHRVTLENPDILQPFHDQQQSLLLLTCHQGNWEWLLHVVSAYIGCPIDAVYKTLHERAMDEFMFECRARSGKPIVFKDAGREVLRRRREWRGFAMLADQAPFKRDKQRHWHPFFGRPGSFYLGPQKIAEAAQYPVIFVSMTQTKRGHYNAHFEVLAQPPYERGGSAILDNYIVALEKAIRRQPELWLWSNRKWKHKPPPQSESSDSDQTEESTQQEQQ